MSETTLLAKTVRLLALVFIVSVYSIAVLSTVDDASILLNRSITIIPIISAKITSSLFFGLMPVIVLLLYHYFQYSLVSLKTRVNRHDAHKPEADPSDADSIFADLLGIQLRRHARFSNYAATAISHFTVWVIAPLTIFLAWIRYLPRHDLLGSYYHALILWLLLALPVMRYSFRRTSRRQASRIVLFSVTIVAALMLLVTHSLARGIPGVCFETKPHDLNHPFFEYQLVEHECRARGHWVARLVIRQWLNAGLSLGADLIYVDLSPKLRPGEPSMGPFVFPHLDLTNVRAIALVMPSALLPYANLTGAALPSSGLSDSNLKYATLYMTDLREAKLRETSFIRTTLSYVDFDHAKMERTWFRGSKISNTKFTHAVLKGAQMECATFMNTDLDNADVSDADVTHARFIGCKLGSIGLTQAQLDSACGSGNTFGGNSHLKLRECPAAWQDICKQEKNK